MCNLHSCTLLAYWYHYSGTPLNGHLRYNGHFQVSRMFLHIFQYTFLNSGHPLLGTTNTNLVPVCTHAIENTPRITDSLATPGSKTSLYVYMKYSKISKKIQLTFYTLIIHFTMTSTGFWLPIYTMSCMQEKNKIASRICLFILAYIWKSRRNSLSIEIAEVCRAQWAKTANSK